MVVITFQNLNVSEPVHLLTSLNNWEPVPMTQQEDGSEDQNGVFTHSLSVPDKVSKILYKFRIGEDHYLHDESAPAEPDGFGGFNNTLNLPLAPKDLDSIESILPLPATATTDTTKEDVHATNQTSDVNSTLNAAEPEVSAAATPEQTSAPDESTPKSAKMDTIFPERTAREVSTAVPVLVAEVLAPIEEATAQESEPPPEQTSSSAVDAIAATSDGSTGEAVQAAEVATGNVVAEQRTQAGELDVPIDITPSSATQDPQLPAASISTEGIGLDLPAGNSTLAPPFVDAEKGIQPQEPASADGGCSAEPAVTHQDGEPIEQAASDSRDLIGMDISPDNSTQAIEQAAEDPAEIAPSEPEQQPEDAVIPELPVSAEPRIAQQVVEPLAEAAISLPDAIETNIPFELQMQNADSGGETSVESVGLEAGTQSEEPPAADGVTHSAEAQIESVPDPVTKAVNALSTPPEDATPTQRLADSQAEEQAPRTPQANGDVTAPQRAMRTATGAALQTSGGFDAFRLHLVVSAVLAVVIAVWLALRDKK